MGDIIRRCLPTPRHKSKADEEGEAYASNGTRLQRPRLRAHGACRGLARRISRNKQKHGTQGVDVHRRWVARLAEWWVWVCGENCGVEECSDSERELWVWLG